MGFIRGLHSSTCGHRTSSESRRALSAIPTLIPDPDRAVGDDLRPRRVHGAEPSRNHSPPRVSLDTALALATIRSCARPIRPWNRLRCPTHAVASNPRPVCNLAPDLSPGPFAIRSESPSWEPTEADPDTGHRGSEPEHPPAPVRTVPPTSCLDQGVQPACPADVTGRTTQAHRPCCLTGVLVPANWTNSLHSTVGQ